MVRQSQSILLFQSSFCQSNNREYEAVFRRARELGVNVQVVQYGKAAYNQFKAVRTFDRAWVRETLEFWHPDGCIVESGSCEFALAPSDFGKTPVVFLDCHPSRVGRGVPCVTSDSTAIAVEAAKELLRLGFAHYAYFSFHSPVVWSQERQSEFVSIMRKRGFDPLIRSIYTSGRRPAVADVARAVLALPKPCGVFAANDVVAEQVVMACVSNGISVPDEIAVVGVDNDEQLCENAPVSLSSIGPDYPEAGRLAVDCLMDRLAHPRRKCPGTTFGTSGLVRRASTLVVAGDRRVRRGLEFIRTNAARPIAVPDVVAAMGCSRRLADLRFGAVVHHSILDEIIRVKIARACALLVENKLSVSEISAQCGYSSDIVFRRVFKAQTGLTPLNWKRHPKVA